MSETFDASGSPETAGQPIYNRPSPRMAGGLSLLLLAAVGYVDYVTSWRLSFTFFYLVPIVLATWYLGRAAGVFFSLLSAAVCFEIQYIQEPNLNVALWNGATRACIFLVVCLLLQQHKARRKAFPRRFLMTTQRMGLLVSVFVCLLGAISLYAHWNLPGPAGLVSSSGELDGRQASTLLAELAAETDSLLRQSRPELLGSRDPKGPSCVDVSKPGDVRSTVPTNMGDYDGGPGTKLAVLYFGDRLTCRNALEDFAWHQRRLRTLMDNLVANNDDLQRLAGALSSKAQRFLDGASRWQDVPRDFTPLRYADRADWPSYCLTSLNEAAAAKDLAGVKRWAMEYAAAMFSVEDLHRWLAFLAKNQLAALDFQAKCESLFTWANPRIAAYDLHSSIDHFPAGLLGLHGLKNFYEVERQAERLFNMPEDRLAELASNKHFTPGSAWVMPGVRECFLKLQRTLSPANRRTWEQAARSPFEHSYLNNMLYRAWKGDMAEQLAGVLRQFDANNPQASVTDLMGVLMYRGHSFGGLEWADRFQPQLMELADQIKGSDVEAFFGAYQRTHDLYDKFANYGATLTLRDAFEQHKLDCVRVTDMIGSIYRNTGRARFGHIRWCAGVEGHSVASIRTVQDGRPAILILDGMTHVDKPEVWPDAYFRGHAWPPALANNPPPYAAELYARGLDNYIWAEGYIIRDANAGTLMKAAIPYIHRHETASCDKVFGGPYPTADTAAP